MSEDEKAPGKEIAKPDEEGESEGKREGWLRWSLGWVVLPGVVITTLFGGGALVGAHFHDSWFTSAIVWIVQVF